MGIVWGGVVLLVGLINLASPDYGGDLLELLSEIYPGFGDPEDAGGFGNLLIGTAWSAVDGLVVGALIAAIYNRFAKGSQ